MLFSPIQLYNANWPDALEDTTSPGFGRRYETLWENLANVDPYFSTLSELRLELGKVFRESVGVS